MPWHLKQSVFVFKKYHCFIFNGNVALCKTILMIYVNYFLCRAMCLLNEIINELGCFVSEHDHIFSYAIYFLLRQLQGWLIHETLQLQIGLYPLGAKWISAALLTIWNMYYRKIHVISHYPNLSIHLLTFKNNSMLRGFTKKPVHLSAWE